MVSKRFSAEPVFIAASTSSITDKFAACIAHPERFGALFYANDGLYRE
jgi:hypothetical protein